MASSGGICSYRGCKASTSPHGSPHLFESLDIEAFERAAAQSERDAIALLFWKKPRMTRAALLSAINAREHHRTGTRR